MGTTTFKGTGREEVCRNGTPRGGTRRSGQVLVLFAFSIIVLAMLCIFAIDIGRLYVVKAQLQNAVDAAALAGASQITTGIVDDDDKTRVRDEVVALAGENIVDGAPLLLDDSDIVFGHFDRVTHVFTPEPAAPAIDSVQVRGRLTNDSPNGAVKLFFGPLFGWNEQEFRSVVAIGTKPRRYAMFVLDRSGSMCFDTVDVDEKPYQLPMDSSNQTYLLQSPTGWYWLPELARRQNPWGSWTSKTAWFFAKDTTTGAFRTAFLPDHIKARLQGANQFNFRTVDAPDTVTSGWLWAPSDVTIYMMFGVPWEYAWADDYYDVVENECGYALANTALEPIQSTMDAACAFTDLLSTEDDMAGLVSYASAAKLDQTLTADFPEVKKRVKQMVPAGSTAEPAGMKLGNDELLSSRAQAYGHKIMILLTDGNANVPSGGSTTYSFLGKTITCGIGKTAADQMATQATRARDNFIRIYCVSFGADADQTLHPLVASTTRGAYYYAADEENLVDVFLDIFERLPPVITK